MQMRTLVATIATLVAVGGTALGQTSSSVTHLVQDGASVNAFGSDPDGNFYVNAWATTRRGPDGMSEAYVYFNASRQVGPDGWEFVSGSGYVPGTALKVTGNGMKVEITDLTTVPGYFLSAGRCEMFGCYELPLPSSYPVDIVVMPDGRASEQRHGVTRRHNEFAWMAASVDVVEVGSSTSGSAVAAGRLGERQISTANSNMSGAWIAQSRGATITIERSSGQ
jgi:hypothetical protein